MRFVVLHLLLDVSVIVFVRANFELIFGSVALEIARGDPSIGGGPRQAPARAPAPARPARLGAACPEPAPGGCQPRNQPFARGEHREGHGNWRQRPGQGQREGRGRGAGP